MVTIPSMLAVAETERLVHQLRAQARLSHSWETLTNIYTMGDMIDLCVMSVLWDKNTKPFWEQGT